MNGGLVAGDLLVADRLEVVTADMVQVAGAGLLAVMEQRQGRGPVPQTGGRVGGQVVAAGQQRPQLMGDQVNIAARRVEPTGQPGLRFGELAGLRCRRVHLNRPIPVLQVVEVRYQAGDQFGSGFKPRPKSDAGTRSYPSPHWWSGPSTGNSHPITLFVP